MMTNKICSKCKLSLSLDMFYKRKDGYEGRCIKCAKLNKKIWRINNIEKVKDFKKKSRIKNSKNIKEYAEKYRLNQPEIVKKNIKELHDCYLTSHLRSRIGIRNIIIPKELLQAQRSILLMKRELRRPKNESINYN